MGGANKPHSIARVDARGVARAYAAAMAEGEPTTLAREELNLEQTPVTRSPAWHPVFARIHYLVNGRITPIRVAGYTNTWTETATEIRWITPTGDRHAAWVWSNAVTPRHEPVTDRALDPVQRGIRANEAAANPGHV